MDPLIGNLKSTTFFGRRFTRREISDIRETVALFPGNSRNELARTICEHPDWYNPRGGHRKDAALRVLEQLEALGILTLPPSPARDRPLSIQRLRIPEKPSPADCPTWNPFRPGLPMRLMTGPSGGNWSTAIITWDARVPSALPSTGLSLMPRDAVWAAC